MIFQIQTTKTADKTYLQILQYLIQNYGTQVAEKFEASVKKCVELISHNPELFEFNQEFQCRKGIIDRYTSFFYEVKNMVIIIHFFWHHKRNPRDIDIKL